MKKLSIIISVLSIICILTNVSHGDQYWAKTYTKEGRYYAYSIQQTSDGKYIIAGESSEDIWILKVDNSGNVLWEKSYGGSFEDWPNSIQQTTDGGYIVAGVTTSFGNGKYDILLLKLDSEGGVIWQKAHGGSDWDSAWSIQQTTDGGYIVAGNTNSYDTSGGGDFWILKLTAAGDITWQKTYGDIGGDGAYSIQQTQDGGYIVAGDSYSFITSSLDFWILKLDATGDIIWQKTYGGNDLERCGVIQQIADGGYIVAGYTYSFGAGEYDIWILKLDSEGNISWQKTYGGSGNDYTRSIQQTTDGGYIVAGSNYILKLDVNGNISWQRTYEWINGPSSARTIQQTAGGEFIVAGTGFSSNAMSVMKLNINGEIPNCEISGINDVIVHNTSIISQDTSVIPQTVTGTAITNTNITPQQTSSIKLITCCYDDISDYDSDGLGDACDNCPNNSNFDQNDNDFDGFGDVCDSDDDNDGICDPGEVDPNCIGSDNCLKIPNGPAMGTCTEGSLIGFRCVSHTSCYERFGPDSYYCSMNQENSDSDTLGDACDNCPNITSENQEDGDEDNVGDLCDNCPNTPNQYQLDAYPPGGNNCGDVCDCEGNFNPGEDDDVDGSDAAIFKVDFGRGGYNNPCEHGNPCNGDFDCDGDCDGTDASLFKSDFGRSSFLNPCPACEIGEWCSYPLP